MKRVTVKHAATTRGCRLGYTDLKDVKLLCCVLPTDQHSVFHEEIKSVNDFDAFRLLILGNSFEVLYLLLFVQSVL